MDPRDELKEIEEDQDLESAKKEDDDTEAPEKRDLESLKNKAMLK